MSLRPSRNPSELLCHGAHAKVRIPIFTGFVGRAAATEGPPAIKSTSAAIATRKSITRACYRPLPAEVKACHLRVFEQGGPGAFETHLAAGEHVAAVRASQRLPRALLHEQDRHAAAVDRLDLLEHGIDEHG